MLVVLWYNSNLLSLSSSILIIGVDTSASRVIPLPLELTLCNVSPDIFQLAIFPPLNNTVEPVICPDWLRIKFLFELRIASEFTSNPAIDADVNLANPWDVILELALVISEAAPFISAGVKI